MTDFPPTFDLRADRFRILVSGEAVDGRYAIVETLAQQGSELPVHVHQGEDELLLVLSGRVCVRAGPVEQQLAAGETLLLRRGVPHALRLETVTARLLTIFFPAGFEHYLEAVAQPVSSCQAPPEPQAVGPRNPLAGGNRPAVWPRILSRVAQLRRESPGGLRSPSFPPPLDSWRIRLSTLCSAAGTPQAVEGAPSRSCAPCCVTSSASSRSPRRWRWLSHSGGRRRSTP
ncbi:cupin domain-containing protein [Deinococcus sp. Arct2-2]|nr:cupin domain-containing protein [Deinococcus sp. Arct2-2]